MRPKFIIATLTFLFTSILAEDSLAVTAYPYPVKIIQRDGTALTVILQGDEQVKWAKSLDGYALIYNSQGVYEYAKQDASGDLVPSGVIASDVSERTQQDFTYLASVTKNLTFSRRQVSIMKQAWKSLKSGGLDRSFPTAGSHKLLCILMGFTDKAFTKSQMDFQNLFNQVGYTVDGATGSVRDFFTENSYGNLNLTVDLAGPFTADHPMAFYGNNTNGDVGSLVTEAVQKADPTVNFADYDVDGDGTIESVYIIFAGYGEEAGGGPDCIWSHASSIPPVAFDGKEISKYSCSPEFRGNSGTGITRIGVICHEFGHVLGAPDFYDTDYSTGGQFTGTGNWDLQASGSWNGAMRDGATPAQSNPYIKIYVYNWATATLLTSQTTITLQDAGRNPNNFYRFNTTTPGEYFLIENRQQAGFDLFIPGHGLVIYHVHKDIAYHGINVSHPQKMYPVCASAAREPNGNPSSYGVINSGGCPYPGTGSKSEFTDATIPSQRSWAGGFTEKPITNIKEDNISKTISFCFMGCSNDPDSFAGTPVSKSQINLSWAKNSSNNPVMVAFNTSPVFGTPVNGTIYAAGNHIAGGGTVIYSGALTSSNQTGLSANTTYYYRAWSVLPGDAYSPGIITIAKTLADPDDPNSFAAIPVSVSRINLSWLKNASDNPVLVAFNTSPVFGTPLTGTVYNAGVAIEGGGTVIYNGALTSFNHNGLSAGTAYFYKAWSVLTKSAYSSGVLTDAITGGINEGDYSALVALYNKCNGPNWTRKTNWLTGPVETWEGVTIENNRVVRLLLDDRNVSVGLAGDLPSELANLTDIRILSLANNQLTGTLPASWSALVNLEELNLIGNHFSGTLPDSWSAFVNLQYLYLDENQFTGTLPGSWSTLESLQYLSLHANQLAGPLPVNWSALVNLQTIVLSNNQLTGTLPGSWSALANLQSLILDDNQISGTLPGSWLALANLQKLSLFQNQLTGTLPESWSALINLQWLWLGGNQIAGTLPESWSALVNLEWFDIIGNQIEGILPESWSSLVNVHSFFLRNNRLSGALPGSWSALGKLQWLYLSGNQFSGTLPASWSGLVNLKWLDIGGSQITGSLPESWSALFYLYYLALENNQITGTLPESWSALVNLQYLIIGNNQLTGTLPISWSNLVNLKLLNLYNNQLTGLPDLSSLLNLTDLIVQDNFLDFGDIEPNIGVPKSYFSYSPQAPVGLVGISYNTLGEEVRLSVTVGGQSNLYQWYKNDGIIIGATSAEYVITSVMPPDAGNYTCQITNTVATDLTLTSNPITILTSASSAPLNMDRQTSLNVWPNPAIYQATIGYNLPCEESVVIQVISDSGRVVEELELGKQTIGEHNAYWDTRKLDPGVYFIRIKDSQAFFKKVVITR